MGGQTITPSASTQTISCSGKYMTGNITVNPIRIYKGTPTLSTSNAQFITHDNKSMYMYYFIIPKSILPKDGIESSYFFYYILNSTGWIIYSFAKYPTSYGFYTSYLSGGQQGKNFPYDNCVHGSDVWVPVSYYRLDKQNTSEVRIFYK